MPELPVARRGRPLISPVTAARAIRLETPVGPAEAELHDVRAAKALLVIGHGAGGDLDAADLTALTAAARQAGVCTIGVRQPYRVAGRRAPAPARQLDAAWTSVVEQLRTASGPLPASRRRLPLIVAGRSSGARVACRTASAVGAGAIVCLAFPLHPPGRPESSRVAELEVAVPLLVVQGTRDPFGGPGEFPAGTALLPVEGADHALRAKAVPDAVAAAVDWAVEAVGRG